MKPLDTIAEFDRYLVEVGLRLEAVVIGGTALNLLGIVSRPTRDCDVLYPDLLPEVLDAARTFAREQRQAGTPLADDWLNNGPAALIGQLPIGWQARLQRAFSGVALVLDALGRDDLLRSKLFALCDRGIDLGDCLALAPTAQELRDIVPWLEVQDANPDWPAHAQQTLADLARRLGHGL